MPDDSLEWVILPYIVSGSHVFVYAQSILAISLYQPTLPIYPDHATHTHRSDA